MSEQDRSQDTSPSRETEAEQNQAREEGERLDAGGGPNEGASSDSSDPAEEAGSKGADSADVETDEAAHAGLGDRVDRLTEALARSQAEMANQERRLEREMDKTRRFALERIMRDFVPVLDSLDQAMDSVGEGDDSGAVEGLALTRKLALKVLETHGLETIDPAGKPFDPTWHEAMTAVPSPDVEPDSVIEVLQKGYALHGRLLRPARVVVAKSA